LKAQTQKEVRKMTRTRAWTVSIIATVSLLALVVGIGASTGQFGFPQGGTTVDAQAVTTGDGILNEQPSDAGFDEKLLILPTGVAINRDDSRVVGIEFDPGPAGSVQVGKLCGRSAGSDQHRCDEGQER
jgi:hypothetical protein